MKPQTSSRYRQRYFISNLLSGFLSLAVVAVCTVYSLSEVSLLVIFSLLALLVLLLRVVAYWRFRASEALFSYSLSLPDCADRARVSMQAVCAGSRRALWVYAFSCPSSFDPFSPFRIFSLYGIDCVFFDYYFPSRFHGLISYDQWQFARTVYFFKEGKDTCGSMFARACRVISQDSDFIFMFMPCSSGKRYYTRFSALSRYLSTCFHARSGLDFITYTGVREPKHTSSSRSDVDSSSNYMIDSAAVAGRNVIIIDDLLTSGGSLKSYADNLTSAGANVIGAVFLGKTFSLPSRSRIFLTVILRSLFHLP